MTFGSFNIKYQYKKNFAIFGGVNIPRVISGTAKGHNLKSVKGMGTRPTSDRVKESMFNILAGTVAGKRVLDLFAGTGGLGIEALSRGAKTAVFVDKCHSCCETIRENLVHTKLARLAEVMAEDVQAALEKLSRRGHQFDLVFLDPPYGKGLVLKTLASLEKNGLLSESSLLVAEHGRNEDISEAGSFQLIRRETYGNTALSFYRCSGKKSGGVSRE